jgi:membrane protein
MKVVDSLIGRLDNFQRRHRFAGFALAVNKKYSDDEAAHHAALLTYYGFLAIFPLLLVLTTVVKLLLRGEGNLQHKILTGATNYIPVIGSQLSQNVHSMKSAGLALAVGVLLTLYGARGVADVFRGGVNHVWQVPYARRTGFPGSLFKSLIIILVGGAGFLAAPIISGYAVGFGHHLWVLRVLALLLTLSILFCLFIFLTHTALAVSRPVRDLWVGALVAAIGLLILQSIGTYLITHQLKHLQDLYSTFAIVLGLLYWMYLQAQLVFYALEIDSVRRLGLWPRALNQARLTDADNEAYRLYAQRNSWHAEDEIQLRQNPKKRPLLERLRNLDSEQ